MFIITFWAFGTKTYNKTCMARFDNKILPKVNNWIALSSLISVRSISSTSTVEILQKFASHYTPIYFLPRQMVSLKIWKNSGLDNIGSQTLKFLPKSIIMFFWSIISAMMKLNYFLRSMKFSTFICILIVGKHLHLPFTYRPICLLLSLNKVLSGLQPSPSSKFPTPLSLETWMQSCTPMCRRVRWGQHESRLPLGCHPSKHLQVVWPSLVRHINWKIIRIPSSRLPISSRWSNRTSFPT